MKWEYKVIKCPIGGTFKPDVKEDLINRTLDHEGYHGWELTSTQGIQTGNGASIAILLFLKREKAARESEATETSQPSTPPPLPTS